MVQTIFITGTGSGVGKTLVSAIIAEALQADYWKPIQAGYEQETDSESVRSLLSNTKSKVYPEVYKFKLPVSPYLAARDEGRTISIEKIFSAFSQHVVPGRRLIMETPGGLMTPLNDHELVIDLVMKLNAKVILVTRHYHGSINHSLLTAKACRQKSLRVMGWVFNDEAPITGMDYEDDIVQWSGYPALASIGKLQKIDSAVVKEKTELVKSKILHLI
jgi:dethiobiotin synthetase